MVVPEIVGCVWGTLKGELIREGQSLKWKLFGVGDSGDAVGTEGNCEKEELSALRKLHPETGKV